MTDQTSDSDSGDNSFDSEEIKEKASSAFKKGVEFFADSFKVLIISLLIILPIRMYVAAPFIVEGDSMEPNYHNGEYLIVDELSYRFRSPERGEVVVFRPPNLPKSYYIKRLIGLPGETIEIKDSKIRVYDPVTQTTITLDERNYLTKNEISDHEYYKVTLADDEYYILGDNRNNSLDSRRLGAVSFSHLKGRVLIRAFPFNQFKVFASPQYPQ